MLTQAHRRSIHSSLTPILGEEETDALMSQFPASESDLPATKADLTLAVAEIRADTHDLLRQMSMHMTVVICSAVVGGMALSAAIAAGVAQAIGGG